MLHTVPLNLIVFYCQRGSICQAVRVVCSIVILNCIQLYFNWDCLIGHTVTVSMALQHFAFYLLCQTVVDVWNQMDFFFPNASSQSNTVLLGLSGSVVQYGSFLLRAPSKLSSAWWRTVHTQQIHCVSLIERCSELGYCLPTVGDPVEKQLCTALKLWKVRAELGEC